MWINKQLLELILGDNKTQQAEIVEIRSFNRSMVDVRDVFLAQKAKDDLSIDWLRHRVNALERQNAVLMQKVAGVLMPVPEIVPTRPGTLTVPDFSALPSFEDVGDAEAVRLGVANGENGELVFTK